jgi:RNA polymerase sigma-70 factor (ECF subfamily)
MAMEDRADADFVREALAGDATAFAELVRRYQDYAYGTAIGMVSDFDLARDVVQEAFLCAYRDLGKLKDPARFAGWLQGIVRNMARRALRELARVRVLAAEMAAAPDIDPAPWPDESVMENERRQVVREALQRLGEPNREAVSLHYVNGLSYADIAGYLGVSEATVLGRLQRGRAQLKKELLTMVEDAFDKEHLPPDFSAEITRLLETASAAQDREAAINRLAEIGGAAVDPLCAALGDARPVVRRVAARALCRIGDARAMGPILRLLLAGDYWVSDVVCRTGQVLHIPGVREELLRLAAAGKSGERFWAVEALSNATGDAEVEGRILGIFHNDAEEARLRGYALGALCRLRPGLAGEFVVEALRVPGIRRLSGYAWWNALAGGYVPPLDVCLTGLTRDVAPNNRVLAGLLALRHGPAGVQALETLLHSGSPVEQESAAVTLAGQAHAQAFDVLAEALGRGDHERKWGRLIIRAAVSHYAARLVEWMRSAKPELSASPELARAVAQARLATGSATPADLVDQGPPTLRADALRKLVAASPVAALPELRRCLAEGSPPKLAREAFRQLHDLGPAAEPVVLEMLESPQWPQRKAAVCLLRRWGKLTIEQQSRAQSDPHLAVRHAATWRTTGS